MKLSDLIESIDIPAPVIRAVVRRLGGWEAFKEAAPDIASHGADGGLPGFTYYKDTMAFTKAHAPQLISMAQRDASDCGTGLLETLASFRCLSHLSPDEIAAGLFDPRSEHRIDVYNALAWYALECVASSYENIKE